MAIALLLVSILSGLLSASAAVYLDLGWMLVFGAYVLGGMIASGCTVAVAAASSLPETSGTNLVRKPVSKLTS